MAIAQTNKINWKNVFQSIKFNLMLALILSIISSIVQFTPYKYFIDATNQPVATNLKRVFTFTETTMPIMLALLFITIAISLAINFRKSTNKAVSSLGAIIGTFIGVGFAILAGGLFMEVTMSKFIPFSLGISILNFFLFPI